MKLTLCLLTFISLLVGKNLDTLYHNIEGALLISSLNGDTEFRVNGKLSDSGFIPASTFKIPNTLIGLETGIIDEATTFIWDSITRPYEPWNQNHTLKSAFNFSCVWCYQEIAEELHDSVYLDYLKQFNYGNRKTGDSLTTFWLEGDSRISVNEQVEFLRKIYTNELPISEKHIELLKEIMIIEQTEEYVLRGKTGWANENGWFIGYMEVNDSIWLFANYIRITDTTLLPFRKSLVLDAFRAVGILN